MSFYRTRFIRYREQRRNHQERLIAWRLGAAPVQLEIGTSLPDGWPEMI
jgi:hypothetical protein